MVQQEKAQFTGVIATFSARHIDIAIYLLGPKVTGIQTKLRTASTVDGRGSRHHTIVLIGHSQIGRRISGTTLHHESTAEGEQETVALVERGVGLLRKLCHMVGRNGQKH